MFFDIPRPKKPFQLPKVLGEDELGKLFSALTNKKYKAILFTAYSGYYETGDYPFALLRNYE